MTTPEKPHPDYPLTPRGDGRWCKRIRGKLHYFTGSAQEALDEWLRVKDSLLAGRQPPPKGEYLTVGALLNRFLTWKTRQQQSDELAPRTLDRYKATCEFLVEALGAGASVEQLTPLDFEELRCKMAKRWGKVALGNEIGMVRTIFNYAGPDDSGLLETPVRFGKGFARPRQKHLRAEKRESGPKLFTQDQIHAVLKAASVNVKAMVLLGINCGMGNTDCGMLPLSAVDLQTGWLDYPRTKTEVERRVPLWPETVKALRAAIKARREPTSPDDSGLLFIGARGGNYAGKHKGYRVGQEYAHAAKAARVARSFYDLRRTFQTIGEESGDVVAVASIMGHAPKAGDMAATYRQVVTESRLRRVTDHVRSWLFSEKKKRQGKA